VDKSKKACYRRGITSNKKCPMAKVNAEGTLKIFVKKSFTSREGETVEYSTAYFLCEHEDADDEVLVVNTKQDLSGQIDKTGHLTLEVRPDGKLALVRFA